MTLYTIITTPKERREGAHHTKDEWWNSTSQKGVGEADGRGGEGAGGSTTTKQGKCEVILMELSLLSPFGWRCFLPVLILDGCCFLPLSFWWCYFLLCVFAVAAGRGKFWCLFVFPILFGVLSQVPARVGSIVSKTVLNRHQTSMSVVSKSPLDGLLGLRAYRLRRRAAVQRPSALSGRPSLLPAHCCSDPSMSINHRPKTRTDDQRQRE